MVKRSGPPAKERPLYLLTLRPEPSKTDPGGIRRLRACLKNMLRGYGMRCLSAVQTGGAERAPDDAALIGSTIDPNNGPDAVAGHVGDVDTGVSA